MIRSFIAVNITQTSRNVLGQLIGDLRILEPGDWIRWVDPNKIHLTLMFLGDIREDQENRIAESLDRVSLPQSFPIYLAGMGCFPDAERARVLWVGVQEGADGILSQIQVSIQNAMIDLGFRRDKKRFSPHLTIARIKKPVDGERMKSLINQHDTFKIEEIISEVVFMRSHLTSAGSIYTPMHSIRLMERI